MKNVIKDEIDHIGAYLCGHKLSELLNLHYNGLKVLFEGRKRHLKNLMQWRLFCFVLFCFIGRRLTAFVFKQVKNCHSDDNHNDILSIGRRSTAFVFKQVKNCHSDDNQNERSLTQKRADRRIGEGENKLKSDPPFAFSCEFPTLGSSRAGALV